MDDNLSTFLYLIILVIVGLVTLVKKVMEKATSGEAGKKIDLAKVVQEQMERYMRGGPPGRFGGGGIAPTVEEEPFPARPSARAVPPPRLDKPAPPALPQKRPVRRISEETAPLAVKADISKRQSLVNQAPPQAGVTLTRSRSRTVPLTKAHLRKAVLFAEVLGPPVSERDEYRLF